LSKISLPIDVRVYTYIPEIQSKTAHRCSVRSKLTCDSIFFNGSNVSNEIAGFNKIDFSDCLKLSEKFMHSINDSNSFFPEQIFYGEWIVNQAQICYKEVTVLFEETVITYDGHALYSPMADLSTCVAERGFCETADSTFIWNNSDFSNQCLYKEIGNI